MMISILDVIIACENDSIVSADYLGFTYVGYISEYEEEYVRIYNKSTATDVWVPANLVSII